MEYIWKINENIKNFINGPKSNNETLEEIKEAKETGLLHILYQKYQLKYGDDKLNSNIVVPYLENNIVKDLFIINNINDAERLAETHIQKMPNLKEFVFDSIISTQNNEHWIDQRGDFKNAFSVYDNLEPLIKISQERSKLCVSILWLLSNHGKKEVNISDFLLNETMAQLQLAMFGVSDKFQSKTNHKIRDVFYSKNKDYANIFYRELCDELNKSNHNNTIGPLGKILNSRVPKSETELLGNILIFSFAGHDSTGHTLTWCIYELCKNPKLQKILIDEVKSFWKIQKNKVIKYNDFKRLPFMSRCISETLRLYPPIPNGSYRVLNEDDYIIGLNKEKIKLKKGSYIQIPIWSRHYNEELWGKDVNIFNPYREFIDDENYDDDIIGIYNPSSERYSPFIYGPRDCIGKNFSQIEMRIILLYLFSNFEFSLSENQEKLQNLETLFFNDFTMGPRDIYNESLKDNNLGLYVKVKSLISSKL